MDTLLRVSAVLNSGAIGWLNKLSIVAWVESTYEMADAVYREMRTGVQQHGGGISQLIIMDPASGLPDAESRAKLAVAFEECAHAMRCVSLVFEGTGFSAAAVGSAVSSIVLSSAPGTPFKVCSNLVEGALFVGRHLPDPDFSIMACVEAAERLRRRPLGPPAFLPQAELLTGPSTPPAEDDYIGTIAGGRRLE